MWLSANFTSSRKQNILIGFIFLLFCLLFMRGLQLHLGKPITDRIRFHAIPIALSVLYHKHPHDYTGLAAIAFPFQGPGKIQTLINTGKMQKIDDKKLYYWVADDKGFADYVIIAFYLFGAHVISMYFLWFLILLMMIGAYLVSFHKNTYALSFLALLLVGVHVGISTLALAMPIMSANMTPPNINTLSSISLYEPRYLDVLALIPTFYMIFFAFKNNLTKWKGLLPLGIQVVLFFFLYHARSSLGWELAAVYGICAFIILQRTFYYSDISSAVNAIVLIGALAFCQQGLTLYKHYTYHPKYFSGIGPRTIWHNALMGLSIDPVFSKEFDLGISDFKSAQAVIHFARKEKICNKEIETTEPQTLLNSFGNWGEANWVNYEDCAKKLYFSILINNKLRALTTFAIRKPIAALKTIRIATRESSDAAVAKIRNKLAIGFYPFSILNIVALVFLLIISFAELYAQKTKLIFSVSFVLLASFIPAVIFYPDIMNQGGMIVCLAVFIYLLLGFSIAYILQLGKVNFSTQTKSVFPLQLKEEELTK